MLLSIFNRKKDTIDFIPELVQSVDFINHVLAEIKSQKSFEICNLWGYDTFFHIDMKEDNKSRRQFEMVRGFRKVNFTFINLDRDEEISLKRLPDEEALSFIRERIIDRCLSDREKKAFRDYIALAEKHEGVLDQLYDTETANQIQYNLDKW